MARGLPPSCEIMNKPLVELLESIRHCMWHGNLKLGLERVAEIDDELSWIEDPSPKLTKFLRQLQEFGQYVAANASLIPNYAERRRYGESVSTSFVESTVNQVISKRFAKKQQMQWTPRGVHLLMQLRTRVLDGTLDQDFDRWKNARANQNQQKLAA